MQVLRIEPEQLEAIAELIEREGDQLVEQWLQELPADRAQALRERVLHEREYAAIAEQLRVLGGGRAPASQPWPRPVAPASHQGGGGMTFLPQLRDELVAVAPARSTRRRAVRAGVFALIAAPLLTAGALAASGVIGIGSPVPAGPAPDPHRGGGAPIAASTRLLALRVADPAGGPPWGLRLVHTTRGLTCLQTGRIVDGKLGVLGQDGVTGNDGRFHEMPLTRGVIKCAAPDAGGHAFIGISLSTTASGPGPEPGCTVADEPCRPFFPAAEALRANR